MWLDNAWNFACIFVSVHTRYAKPLWTYAKNVHVNEDISRFFNFPNPWKYFTQILCYSFIKTSYLVHLLLCGDSGNMHVCFSAIFAFQFYTKLGKLNFLFFFYSLQSKNGKIKRWKRWVVYRLFVGMKKFLFSFVFQFNKVDLSHEVEHTC